MKTSLEPLAREIASQAAKLVASSSETGLALSRLIDNVAHPRRHPHVSAAHRYASLVARATQGGIGGPFDGIAQQLLALEEPLPWVYHYKPRSAAENLAERVAFAELIGPDGPLTAAGGRVGFTVMAEHTHYPLHSHPAVELYIVIAGTAQWRTETSESLVPPGEMVLHRSNEPHAMRTYAEPLLALWSWSGNVDAPAVYI